jgi:Cdc6-like AAA superfamily ATPase
MRGNGFPAESMMDDIFLGLGANGERQTLRLDRANRHGLIAGATGTGKTVTLQTMAEQFPPPGCLFSSPT